MRSDLPNIPIFLPFILLAAGVAACSPMKPVARDSIRQNLSPIIRVEERASTLTLGFRMLASLGEVRAEDGQALKEHYDIFYVYHKAAAVDLARGDFDSYESHIRSAEAELDAIEMRLRNLLSQKQSKTALESQTY